MWNRETYRDFIDDYGRFFLQKKFYAITPAQEKVPLSEVCNHRPLKMMGDLGEHGRLVLVIECDDVNPDGTELVYWKQAFYFSTGTSSHMKNTWLPVDGIVLGTNDDIFRDNAMLGIHKPAAGEVRDVTYKIWLDKSPFLHARGSGYDPGTPEDERIVRELYNGGFLPEELYSDRFGSFSHAMASYLLGGSAWSGGGMVLRKLMYGASTNPADYVGLSELSERLSPPRPPLDCFVEMVSIPDRLPFSTITEVNDYIGRNKAVSYMAPFSGTALESIIPTPSELTVPAIYDKNRYNLPFYPLVFETGYKLQQLFVSVQTGKTPSDEASVAAAVRDIIGSLGNMPLLTDRPTWNLRESLNRFRFLITKMQGHHARLFGGQSKTFRRKAGKGKSLRRRR